MKPITFLNIFVAQSIETQSSMNIISHVSSLQKKYKKEKAKAFLKLQHFTKPNYWWPLLISSIELKIRNWLQIELTIFYICARIEKEGLTERAIILCKLNKSPLKISISVGIHRQKSLYYLMNLCI